MKQWKVYISLKADSSRFYDIFDIEVTDDEYQELEQYLFNSNIEDGFVQEEESAASEDFIPCFDGTGV